MSEMKILLDQLNKRLEAAEESKWIRDTAVKIIQNKDGTKGIAETQGPVPNRVKCPLGERRKGGV